MGTTRSYACTTQTALTRLGSNVRHTSRVLLGMGARRATLISLLLWRRVLQRLPRLQGGPQKPVSIAGAQLCPWNARRKLYQQVGNFVGSVISPLLANVYLYEVLDTWCETVVQAHCRGKVVLYRYADDVVIGCEREKDARRIIEVLPKRFAKYGLEINTEKTTVVRFGRPQRSSADRQPGTFSFLGFVHYWGKTWRGSYTIKRKTEGKRLRRTLGAFWRWCRDNRHRAPQEQYVLLCAKLRGYYQYYGVRCNSPCLDLVYYAAMRAWRYWLNRRGGRKMTWRAFGRMMAAYPLPRPKIVQGWV